VTVALSSTTELRTSIIITNSVGNFIIMVRFVYLVTLSLFEGSVHGPVDTITYLILCTYIQQE
jgi:hypothetical protein